MHNSIISRTFTSVQTILNKHIAAMTRQQELNNQVSATTINSVNMKGIDFSGKIYRSNGFEAYVIGETEDCWLIDNLNGVRCRVWKHTTKSSIKNVAIDYKLRNK